LHSSDCSTPLVLDGTLIMIPQASIRLCPGVQVGCASGSPAAASAASCSPSCLARYVCGELSRTPQFARTNPRNMRPEKYVLRGEGGHAQEMRTAIRSSPPPASRADWPVPFKPSRAPPLQTCAMRPCCFRIRGSPPESSRLALQALPRLYARLIPSCQCARACDLLNQHRVDNQRFQMKGTDMMRSRRNSKPRPG
jgi:hypothetical protein